MKPDNPMHRAGGGYTWTFLDSFSVNNIAGKMTPSWDAFDSMFAALREIGHQVADELEQHLSRWDEILDDIGGDPARLDWQRFRPLRLSREEDWSDWLAFLIERSEHGFLAHEILGKWEPGRRARQVDREVSTKDGYRADLVVLWSGDHASHIEVKVGDQHFDKTFGTARALRLRYCHCWLRLHVCEGNSLSWRSLEER